MSYISLSDKDKKEMLARIGIKSLDDLYSCIPADLKLNRDLEVPPALTETELFRYFDTVAKKNTADSYRCFLGAGAYRHTIPAIVDYLSMRGEFISPYTPYQPELSQGTLQIIFEFQTLIAQLTEMDIANASLYDGASGAAEAVLMANRLTRKSKVLVAASVHPQYRGVIEAYVKNLELEIIEIGYDDSGRVNESELKSRLDEKTAAFVFQSPNFFGVIEDGEALSRRAHETNALSVFLIAEAVSMGILASPGSQGADIVTGEAQSFGMPLSFGGPYLGFMACAEQYLRQFPGRIAGETKDVDGKRGFVLTLSTREQHIRRERATSNICTNQAWCAVRAAIFMETLGAEGMREMARQNMQKARYALDRLTDISGVEARFSGPVFNEFVLQLERPLSEIQSVLEGHRIIGGLALDTWMPGFKNCLLVNVTEIHTRDDIDALAAALRTAAR
ncbi:MAG: aminomethyl-transferring glycine dehydrogenase subunit GcvPA [Acidobacteria bacterium]|nr:aminomethyl-transferring glycine dehydrogenase subunit GcvPA [Acidobacteriota bacterium]MBU4254018.1 aminomethyl-transferring glycine dehydrogenase subunit GcvPA [Acidobacteriota bacterium]